MTIAININKAKAIAHDARRTARSAEFAPLDVLATVPSEAVSAEQARELIRAKYSNKQVAIDAATTVEQIKEAM
jgi:hypothetical protein